MAPSVNFYVKNLDKSIDDEELRGMFAHFGEILSAKVMRTETGFSKGFGFVSFVSDSVTELVLSEMNGKFVKTKAIYVAVAQKKEDRAKLLAMEHALRQSSTQNFNQ